MARIDGGDGRVSRESSAQSNRWGDVWGWGILLTIVGFGLRLAQRWSWSQQYRSGLERLAESSFVESLWVFLPIVLVICGVTLSVIPAMIRRQFADFGDPHRDGHELNVWTLLRLQPGEPRLPSHCPPAVGTPSNVGRQSQAHAATLKRANGISSCRYWLQGQLRN